MEWAINVLLHILVCAQIHIHTTHIMVNLLPYMNHLKCTLFSIILYTYNNNNTQNMLRVHMHLSHFQDFGYYSAQGWCTYNRRNSRNKCVLSSSDDSGREWHTYRHAKSHPNINVCFVWLRYTFFSHCVENRMSFFPQNVSSACGSTFSFASVHFSSRFC